MTQREARPPSSNTGVVNGSLSTKEGYRWDWSSTTHPASEPLVRDVLRALDARRVEVGGGMQGWQQSVKGYDREGFAVGTVYFGARDDVYVACTSSAADAGRAGVVAMDGAKTARVDTCVDSLVPFDDLRRLCVDVSGQKAVMTYIESEKGGQSLGRTIYIGSPSSAVRVRVYEKWLQAPGQYVDGTNRVEVQLRPPSRAKAMVSGWSKAETFCASELTRRLAGALGQEIARPGSMQKHRGTPDLESTMLAMGSQYGKAVDRWLRMSGGDIGTVFDYLSGEKSHG